MLDPCMSELPLLDELIRLVFGPEGAGAELFAPWYVLGVE